MKASKQSQQRECLNHCNELHNLLNNEPYKEHSTEVMSFISRLQDDKSEKIKPIKIHAPETKISFKDPLKLYSTLEHNKDTDKCAAKAFNVQIVYKHDSDKGSFEKEIDIKEYFGNNDKVHVLRIKEDPLMELSFRVLVIFKEEMERKKKIDKEKYVTLDVKIDKESATNTTNFGKKKSMERAMSSKKIELEFEEKKKSESINKVRKLQKEGLQLRSTKVIKFQQDNDDDDYNDYEPNSPSLLGEGRGHERKKSRYKTLNSPTTPVYSKSLKHIEDSAEYTTSDAASLMKNITNQSHFSSNPMGEEKSLVNVSEIGIDVEEFEKLKTELKIKSSKNIEIEKKYREIVTRCKQMEEKYLSLKKAQQKQDQQNVDEESHLRELKEKEEKLEKELESLKQKEKALEKKLQSSQEEHKKEKTLASDTIKKLEKKLEKLTQENQQLKNLQQLETEQKGKKSEESNTSLKRLEESIGTYKERIRILEKQLDNIQEEKNFFEKESSKYEEQVSDLKIKIKQFHEDSLKQLKTISEKDYEIEKQQKRISELLESHKEVKKVILKKGKMATISGNEISNVSDDDDNEDNDTSIENGTKGINNFKSERFLGGNYGGNYGGASVAKLNAEIKDLKAKLNITTKQLENKEKLLKGFDQFNQEEKKQREAEINELKQENKRLSELLAKHTGTNDSMADSGGMRKIEEEMEIRKLRTELEYKTKLERKLLKEKSQLEASAKIMSDDIIKSKEAIASMVNVIHEFGNETLIEEINEYLC